MKNKLIYLTICIGFILMSCGEEEDRGQYPLDNVAPGIITDIEVKNAPGASLITYTVPDDIDLLYVEAQYQNGLGKLATRRASSYTGNIVVDGFLRSSVIPVKIVCVDKSKNRSEQIVVEIEPLDNGIFDIFASLEFEASFGGVKLDWENDFQQEVVLEVLTLNSNTETYETYENIYTLAESATRKVRGLDAIETSFGIVIRDRVGLRTDTLKFSLTPYFEEELNYEKFRLLAHNPNLNTTGHTTGFASLFNDYSYDSFNITGYGIGRTYFTMDIGEEYKFSRFTFWTRNDFTYGHSQPKHFILLGTNDLGVASDPFSEDAAWDVIGDYNDEKPSGNSSTVPPTSEDEEYFANGLEFDVDLSAGSYRYVRWVTLETWGGTDRMWLGELDIFGQKIVTDEE